VLVRVGDELKRSSEKRRRGKEKGKREERKEEEREVELYTLLIYLVPSPSPMTLSSRAEPS
jgi:hypothetical protein